MIVRLRDATKLLGVMIMCACAILPCALFLNHNLDLMRIKDQVVGENAMTLYDITINSGNATIAITGGTLALTTAVMLFFYIKQYIDAHRAEFGILKAMGYSNFKIAKNFWIFGLSVMIGTGLGLCIAYVLMSFFYQEMETSQLLPEIIPHFNSAIVWLFVVVPTVVFAAASVFYGCRKLRRPALELIKGQSAKPDRIKKPRHNQKESKIRPFLDELKRSILKNRPILVFFIGLAAFCYSATIQMGFSMSELSSQAMGIMMAGIGIVLACTTLLIAVTTVVKNNTKTIAMLRLFGYSDKECSKAVLSGYRPAVAIGFVGGAVYQFVIMKTMMALFYDDAVADVPEYNFNTGALVFALISFVILYEALMLYFAARIKRVPAKEVMLEN